MLIYFSVDILKIFQCWHTFRCFWTYLAQTCMMIDTLELYILIGPWLSFNVTVVRERKNFSAYYLNPTNFFNDLNGIFHALRTSWSHEPHTQFILSDQDSSELSLFMWFLFLFNLTLACIQTFTNRFPSNWNDYKDHWSVHLIPVWMTLTFFQGHSYVRNEKFTGSGKFCWQFGWN